MPLHLTKVAFGAQSLAELHAWFRGRGGEARLTTRYLPKRHAELVGGSLYWIHKHQLVARSRILGFEEADGGRTSIVISADLVEVQPVPCRAHQGWRYLEDKDAPPDRTGAGAESDELPAHIASELVRLGLV